MTRRISQCFEDTFENTQWRKVKQMQWRILGLSWLWRSERRGGKYSRDDDDNDNDNDGDNDNDDDNDDDDYDGNDDDDDNGE